MPSVETIAPDGSWKVVVDAWKSGVVLYSALGVTTRVYERGPRGWWEQLWNLPEPWYETTVEVVTAAGSLASSVFPGPTGPIPGSPNRQTNSSSASCKAWWFGGTIGVDTTRPPGEFPFGGGGASSLNPIADRVKGAIGTAVRNGLVLSAGPVDA